MREKMYAGNDELLATQKISYDVILEEISKSKEIPAVAKLLENLEDTDPEDQGALKKIWDTFKRIKEKRGKINEKKFTTVNIEFEKDPLHRELEQKALEQLGRVLAETKKKGRFLGEGATGIAHVDIEEPTRCYKIIYDSEEYKNVNSVAREAAFLDSLADLKIDGVRTPKPHYWAMHENFHVLVMETLNAISLDKIAQGFEKCPEQFSVEKFFNKLEKYVREMHNRGIHHRDLNLQNIMVDKETGDPYIIDFGKSCHAMMDEDPYLIRNEETKQVFRYPDDLEKIAENRLKMREYVAKNS